MKNLNKINKKEFDQYKTIIKKIIPHLDKQGKCYKNKNHDACMKEVKATFSKISKSK